MNEKIRSIWEYIKDKPGWFSAIIIGVGRAILYSFQVGYTYYFNVGIRRIDILNGNIVFQLLLYAVLAGLLIFFYQIGYDFYKKGKLLVYFGGFGLIFFVLCVVFVLQNTQQLPPFWDAVWIGVEIILMSVVVTLVFNFIVLSHIFCPSLKDKIDITEIKLKRAKKKAAMRLNEKLENLKMQRAEADRNRNKPEEMSVIQKVIFCIGIISLCFIIFLCFGYVNASSKTEFKIVDNAYITLECEDYHDGFAVVFEDNDEYVVVPCEHTDGELRLYVKKQLTVEERDILTVEKSFNKVKCVM